MKLAAMDTMWLDLPLKERLYHVAELGFEGIQFWVGSAELGYKVAKQWPSDHIPERVILSPRELAELSEDSKVDIVALGQHILLGDMTGLRPTQVDLGKKRADKIEDIKAMMNYVAEEGSKIVIVETGGDPEKPEQWNSLIEVVNEVVSHAEKVGAILAVEHSPIFLVDTIERLIKLMREIDSKALKVNFDPANLVLTPPGNHDVVGAIKKLKDHLIVMHAKDAIFHDGPYGTVPGSVPTYDCPPIGKGQVPWNECISALKEIGFKGYLIIEFAEPVHSERKEGPEEGTIESKRYLEKLISGL